MSTVNRIPAACVLAARMNRLPALLLATLGATLISMTCFCPLAAADVVSVSWTGDGDGLTWADAGNWDPAVEPNNNSEDTYRVTLGSGALLVELLSPVTIDSLTVVSDAQLDIDMGAVLSIATVHGVTNDGEIRLGGPAAGGGRLRLLVDCTLSGQGRFVSAEASASSARIEANPMASVTLTIPAGSDLKFQSNTSSLARSIGLVADNIVNLGAITASDLDALVIGALQLRNSGTISTEDTSLSLEVDELTSETSRGQITITGGAGSIRNGSLENQDISVINGEMTLDNADIRNSALEGRYVVVGISPTRIESLSAANDPLTLVLADGDLLVVGEVNGENLAVIEVPAGNIQQPVIGGEALPGQAPRLVLARTLEVEGGGSLVTAPAPNLVIDLNGQNVFVLGSGTAVTLSDLVFGGGAVQVTGGASVSAGNWSGVQGGGEVSVDADSTLNVVGVVDTVQMVSMLGPVNGSDGTLRDLTIPQEARLSGNFRFDGDIVLNGTIILGRLKFDDSGNTLSGSGTVRMDLTSPRFGVIGGFDNLNILPGSTVRFKGGGGQVNADTNNAGQIILEQSGLILWQSIDTRNSGRITATSGTLDWRSRTDNTGGEIAAEGTARINLGTSATGIDHITGGTIRGPQVDQKRTAKGTPAAGIFVQNTSFTGVTVEGHVQVLKSAGGLASLSLESSLTNNGNLEFVRDQDYARVEVLNSDSAPFEIRGDGTIDFGDGTLADRPANGQLDFRVVHMINRGNTLTGNASINNGFFPGNTLLNEGRVLVDDAIGLGLGGEVTNTGVVDVTGAGLFSAGAFRNEGMVRVSPGATAQVSGYVQAAGSSAIAGDFVGSLTYLNGAFDYSGSEPLSNVHLQGGVFAVGDPGIGTTVVSGTFGMDPASAIAFQLGGLVPGTGHDVLQTNTSGFGSTTLDGTLVIETANQFVPQPGDAYQIISFTGQRNGTEFSQVVNATPFPDLDFTVEYNGNFFGDVRVLVGGDPGVVVEADLEVTVAQCVQVAAPGQPHEFVVVVENRGPDPAANAALSIILPPAGMFDDLAGLPTQCTRDDRTVNCQYPQLAADQVQIVPLTLLLSATAAGSPIITAEASADQADPAEANDSASLTFRVIADLVEADSFESCDGS